MIARVRALRAARMAAAVLATSVAGCTFLIDFEDVPAPGDGGRDAPIQMGPPDVRIDGNDADAEASVDAGPDVRDAIANPNACKGNPDGKYCGGNQIVWPVEHKDDLVTCRDGGVANVRFCPGLGGCVRMVDGKPDQCDGCGGKANGTYCGRDMGGWETENLNLLVTCQNGAKLNLMPCGAAGCLSKGAQSSCK